MASARLGCDMVSPVPGLDNLARFIVLTATVPRHLHASSRSSDKDILA